jgi:hypothetical protein
MIRDLAQAIHDLATTGRLSEESTENIAFLLTDAEPVSDVAVTATDNDTKSTPVKATAASKSGGK